MRHSYRIYCFGLVAVLLAACGAKDKRAVTLDGEIKGLGTDTLYLYGADKMYSHIDTLFVSDDRFSAKLTTDTLVSTWLLFSDGTQYPLYFDKGEHIQIAGDTAALQQLDVKGNSHNTLLSTFLKEQENANRSLEEIQSEVKTFIQANPASLAGIYLLDRYLVKQPAPDYKQIEELVGGAAVYLRGRRRKGRSALAQGGYLPVAYQSVVARYRWVRVRIEIGDVYARKPTRAKVAFAAYLHGASQPRADGKLGLSHPLAERIQRGLFGHVAEKPPAKRGKLSRLCRRRRSSLVRFRKILGVARLRAVYDAFQHFGGGIAVFGGGEYVRDALPNALRSLAVLFARAALELLEKPPVRYPAAHHKPLERVAVPLFRTGAGVLCKSHDILGAVTATHAVDDSRYEFTERMLGKRERSRRAVRYAVFAEYPDYLVGVNGRRDHTHLVVRHSPSSLRSYPRRYRLCRRCGRGRGVQLHVAEKPTALVSLGVVYPEFERLLLYHVHHALHERRVRVEARDVHGRVREKIRAFESAGKEYHPARRVRKLARRRFEVFPVNEGYVRGLAAVALSYKLFGRYPAHAELTYHVVHA